MKLYEKTLLCMGNSISLVSCYIVIYIYIYNVNILFILLYFY